MFNLDKFKKFQFFWNIAARFAVFLPKRKFKAMPQQIIIELTNSCNLRCPVCPTHFAMKRKKGLMDFELYKSIIDEFKNFTKKPEIAMNFAGEPLLHPQIAKFVEYAAKNSHKIFISTNATFLTRDLSEKLIKAGLSSINLCLESLIKESHETYRKGSNFESVKKNIEDFLAARKELNSRTPYISIQTLLTSFSENEIDDMAQWAKNKGADGINFKTFSLGSYTTNEMKERYGYLLPIKEEFKRKISNINKTLCSWPLKNSVVYWNGNIGFCCADFDNKVRAGNIKENGFLNTYFSDEVVKKRISGFQKRFDLCKRCSIGNADFLGININLKI